MLLWVAGGVISLIGALCYAELATAYPHAGGDYHFLTRAFGRSVSFLFGWARMTIIQPGSIALQAYIIGDYMTQVTPLGPASSSIYAGTTVVLLTAINIAGIIQGKWTQNLLTVSTVAAVAARGRCTSVCARSSAEPIIRGRLLRAGRVPTPGRPGCPASVPAAARIRAQAHR